MLIVQERKIKRWQKLKDGFGRLFPARLMIYPVSECQVYFMSLKFAKGIHLSVLLDLAAFKNLKIQFISSIIKLIIWKERIKL